MPDPTLEERVATLEHQMASVRSVIWTPEPEDSPVFRIEALEAGAAKLRKIHDTHGHPTGPFGGPSPPPGAPAADPVPAGPGPVVQVPPVGQAMAQVWHAGELPESFPTYEMPEPFCVFFLGPGAHRVQPSLIPGCVRAAHPDGAFDAVDISVSGAGAAPLAGAVWRHYDHNPPPGG